MNKIRLRLIQLAFFIVSFLAIQADVLSEPAHPEPVNSISQTAADNKISFYFQNIEVRSLLQLIAKSSGVNFIISDAVKGSMSLNLKNVTWQQALDVILSSRGLASRKIGNVIYVSTIEEISASETKRMASEEQMLNLAPLASKVIHLNYALATDVANILKGPQNQLLTPRGQVAVDTRTNTLFVRDTPTSLNDIVPKVIKLDIPARQVLIEARIVNINTTYEQELGVRFGVSDTRHLSGTFQGANSIAQGNNPANVMNAGGTVDPTQRLNFNIPATTLFDGSTPAGIAVALAHIGPALLDLELSALEGEDHAHIIARPRVITSNQQKAMIQTGEEIPYQQATSSGATSITFKDAVLSLEITPQITPDDKIILSLKATENSKGENIITGGTGGVPTSEVPAINTQAVQSNVLLNNNETIVLGGVYKQTKDNAVDRIPFFGSLPVVGALFRHNHVEDQKNELLIFITPKIIEPLKKSRGVMHATVKKTSVYK